MIRTRTGLIHNITYLLYAEDCVVGETMGTLESYHIAGNFSNQTNNLLIISNYIATSKSELKGSFCIIVL